MENKIFESDVSKIVSMGINNEISNCMFLGDNIIIGNNCTLKNVVVGEGTFITDSYIEDSIVGRDCEVGPFARIRKDARIGDGCRIGNFVEVKNSRLGSGVKSCHLSYIGDAIVGDGTNIGCGVVFANYNGVTKNTIVVGKDCFIGSNCTLIAPLKIGDESYICAGSVVTDNTDNGDFVIGRVKSEKKIKYSFYKRNYLNVDKSKS